jgi:hypothetical protein
MVEGGRLGGLAACAVILATSLIGCQDKEAAVRPDPNAGLSPTQRTDKVVATIPDNVNMSPQARERMMAQIRAHAGGGTKGNSPN